MRAALHIVLKREHLRQTLRIAAVVGVVLGAINHGDTILAGEASRSTAIKLGITFIVPFVVSNLGLLAGKRTSGEL